MECKWHPGEEAELTCLKCGENYCRRCVVETREPNYCPDCHRAEVERFASRMSPPPGEKESKEAAKKAKKEKAPKKQLRRPKEKAEAPPAPPVEEVEEEPGTVTPGEKAEFWREIDRPEKSRRLGRKAEPVQIEGLPPVPAEAPAGQPAPEESFERMPELVPEGRKRRIQKAEVREKAVLTSEGFPERRAGEERERSREPEAKGKHAVKRRPRKVPGEEVVAFQVPEDYDGETTPEPSYFKALMWGAIVGLVGAGAYAGLTWWLHKPRGIFAWVIGLAVGLAVVFGSGRHFNWKLGLMAVGLTFFFISIGQVAFFMLDTRFNRVIAIPLPFSRLLTESFSMYIEGFTDWRWVVMLFALGLLPSFLITFRPPPFRLQTSGQPAGGAVRRNA